MHTGGWVSMFEQVGCAYIRSISMGPRAHLVLSVMTVSVKNREKETTKETQDTIQVLMEPGLDLPFGACFQVLAQTLDNGESSVLQMNYRNMSARMYPPMCIAAGSPMCIPHGAESVSASLVDCHIILRGGDKEIHKFRNLLFRVRMRNKGVHSVPPRSFGVPSRFCVSPPPNRPTRFTRMRIFMHFY